jgi:inhibitor of KinA sporulation pathway (predicted exonuclease)
MRLEGETLGFLDEYSRFVRPVEEPQLSNFCRELTGIRQADVDAADEFGTVFPDFVRWIGEKPFTLSSWSAYDLNQFRIDCARHGLVLPAVFLNHRNLKVDFAMWRGEKACGMRKALRVLGLELEGRHHRGIDDARNIARICRKFLPSYLARERSA